ncbi:MAG: glycosyltransferase family 39 protein [Cyanobacteria bacterium J06621_11]
MTLETHNKPAQRRLWSWIIFILIGLGIFFRLSNLSDPVYWVDEVATSMRISGYTQAEVVAAVATENPITIPDLQQFQTIRTDRELSDLSRVLSQSPEHAPLYFILVRFWAELFGNSVTAMRSLSVLFNSLTIPVIFSLCKSYFQQNKTVQSSNIFNDKELGSYRTGNAIAQSAAALFAISPFFIAYAQEARPYSLWILLLLLTYQYLWKSLQTNRWQHWFTYTFALTLTLYTSLLTVFIACGQTLAIFIVHRGDNRENNRKYLRPYLLTTTLAFLALSPWCWIILTRWQTLQSNTAWMRTPGSIFATLGTWFYSLAVLFFDVPVATNPIIFALQALIATVTIALIGYATYVFIQQAPRPIWSLVLTNALAVPFSLLLIDLARNGQAAATPRYLMPTHLGAIIVLAYWLRAGLFSNSQKRRAAISFILLVSLLSCLITQPSPYLKSRNLSNQDITTLLNEIPSLQLITTPHFIQDLISLSYQLEPDISLYILPTETASPETILTTKLDPQKPTVLFAPSEAMRNEIKEKQLGKLQSLYQPPPLTSGGFPLTVWRLDARETGS